MVRATRTDGRHPAYGGPSDKSGAYTVESPFIEDPPQVAGYNQSYACTTVSKGYITQDDTWWPAIWLGFRRSDRKRRPARGFLPIGSFLSFHPVHGVEGKKGRRSGKSLAGRRFLEERRNLAGLPATRSEPW